MDKRRFFIHVRYEVDASNAPWRSILNSVERRMGKLIREFGGVEGVSVESGELVYESGPQGD